MSNIPKITIELRPSEFLVGQVGVYATVGFDKGEIVIKKDIFDVSVFCSWSDYQSFDDLTKKKILDYGLGNKEGTLIPPDFNNLSIPWHMNHKCDYNVGFNRNNDFIAIREIKVGEELCWDYGLGEANPNFKLVCECGSKNCRKIITGNDWQNPNYKATNLEYMLNELR